MALVELLSALLEANTLSDGPPMSIEFADPQRHGRLLGRLSGAGADAAHRETKDAQPSIGVSPWWNPTMLQHAVTSRRKTSPGAKAQVTDGFSVQPATPSAPHFLSPSAIPSPPEKLQSGPQQQQ